MTLRLLELLTTRFAPFSKFMELLSKIDLNKKERKELIAKISKASGIAQYALTAKMTDEEIIKAANNLEIFSLVKAANNYNRYCQGQKTKEANDKFKKILKELTDIKNSEILKFGNWLINALSHKATERKQTLSEKSLVHQDDYNHDVADLKDTLNTVHEINIKSGKEAIEKIRYLENKIDSLKSQLAKIQEYIINNYGQKPWIDITKKTNLKRDDYENY